jgi:hypothetical protein
MADEFHPAPLGGAWDSALLAPVAEINEQLLNCLRLMAHEEAPLAPRLVTLLREDWRRLNAAALRRLSGCPYLLLDAGFAQPQRWEWIGSAAVMESSARGGYFAGPGGVGLVRRTLVFAWHLARSNRVTARVMLGLSAQSAERIAASRLADLEALAERAPGWIAPRWEQQPNVWRQLLAAGCRAQPQLLRQAQLRGLQLLARASAAQGAADD